MLLSLFGFMDLMIIQKWLTNYPEMGETSRAPAIINVMINLFLNGGEIADPAKEIPIIEHQTFWSKLFLFLALICPPWMLFVKPLLLRREHEEKQKQREKQGGDIEMVESSSDKSPRDENEEYNKIELTPLSNISQGKAGSRGNALP